MKRINGNGKTEVKQAATSVPEPNVKRMLLSAIGKSKSLPCEKIVQYAPEGWGKTTWASKSDSPIFFSTEDGLKGFSVDTFPQAEKWMDTFEAIETLRSESHKFKTLVFDTADWTEHLCHRFIIERDKKSSIEDYGYGKGYVVAFEEWKKLLQPLDALRKEKQMNIVFLAHSNIKIFNNPCGENWDRYEMKLDKRVSALLKEWADCVLFGNYDVAVDINKGQLKGKGYGSERIVYATHTASYDAKNRYGITEPFGTDFGTFKSLIAKGGKK